MTLDCRQQPRWERHFLKHSLRNKSTEKQWNVYPTTGEQLPHQNVGDYTVLQCKN